MEVQEQELVPGRYVQRQIGKGRGKGRSIDRHGDREAPQKPLIRSSHKHTSSLFTGSCR